MRPPQTSTTTSAPSSSPSEKKRKKSERVYNPSQRNFSRQSLRFEIKGREEGKRSDFLIYVFFG
ncbi:hypothetical protein E2C01_030051 [Portunus trituberculatus]|uniref:Uncharacterized protein n=1 Tax=Portunus trituberculatus TaxID=210409 RepID=A0A5B7ETM5_PORTR|nr:hypothetical protein [Portunus trituberculatus]